MCTQIDILNVHKAQQELSVLELVRTTRPVRC